MLGASKAYFLPHESRPESLLFKDTEYTSRWLKL